MNRICTIALTLVLALLASVSLAAAQSPTNAVSVNPLGLIIGVISAEYETQTSPGSAVGFQGFYWNPDLEDDLDLNALGGAVGFRKYISGRTFDGLYFGAYGGFASVSGKAYNSSTLKWESASATVIGVFGVAGIKWLGGNGFIADLGVSLGLPVSTTISSGDITKSDVSGVMSAGVSLALGYAW